MISPQWEDPRFIYTCLQPLDVTRYGDRLGVPDIIDGTWAERLDEFDLFHSGPSGHVCKLSVQILRHESLHTKHVCHHARAARVIEGIEPQYMGLFDLIELVGCIFNDDIVETRAAAKALTWAFSFMPNRAIMAIVTRMPMMKTANINSL